MGEIERQVGELEAEREAVGWNQDGLKVHIIIPGLIVLISIPE